MVIGITHPQTCLVLSGRLRRLREAGFRVILVASPGPWLERTADAEGVEACGIPMRRGIALIEDITSLVRLLRLLRRVRPEVTEFSTPKAGLLGNVAALMCRVPNRVYLLRGLRLETARGWQATVLRWTERLAAACSHSVLCNSYSLRQETARIGIAPLRKLCVLGDGSSMGVDAERFKPGQDYLKRRLGIPADAPVIGFVGRLTRDKGVPELLTAFEQILGSFPEARLLLVGWFDESEDALHAKLRNDIANHRNIVHTGYVADTAPYYRAMDAMVLPTWREGFPNVVLEASASGVPVVTTLATGARDAVIPEVTGMLVPPGYPEAIAEAVLGLLRNPDRSRKMGLAARAWVKDHFMHEHVMDQTVRFYERLVRETEAARAPAVIRDVAQTGD